MRDLTGHRISPDGKSIALVLVQAIPETNSYRTGLFVVRVDSGALVGLGSIGPPRWASGGGRDPIRPEWSPDGRKITLVSRLSGGWQVWQFDPEQGESEQLTHVAGEVQEHEWSSDGRRIVFTVQAPMDQYVQWRKLRAETNGQ